MNEPSVELRQRAETAFGWGIATVVLGWTGIVTVVSFLLAMKCYEVQKKEGAYLPWQARVGMILTLVFGVWEGFLLIRNLSQA